MKLSTCPKGHFYDADKYASCPYCVPQDEAEAVTEALNVTMEDFSTRAPSTGHQQTEQYSSRYLFRHPVQRSRQHRGRRQRQFRLLKREEQLLSTRQ